MTHMQLYGEAGKILREWLKENPMEKVLPTEIREYTRKYQELFIVIEKELFQAYAHEEITKEEYTDKCKFLDTINNDVMESLSRRAMPPSLEALLKLLREKGDKGGNGGGGGGFIVFGGSLPP